MAHVNWKNIIHRFIIGIVLGVVGFLSVCYALWTHDKIIFKPIFHQGPTEYQFLVAGHSYGQYEVNNAGFHPPFFRFLTHYPTTSLSFIVLTGDLVYNNYRGVPFADTDSSYAGGLDEDWDELEDQMRSIPVKFYWAPGNHDAGSVTTREIFLRRSKRKTSFDSFVYDGDLFLLLDGNVMQFPGMPTEYKQAQQEFIESQIKRDFRHLFVFIHYVPFFDYLFPLVGSLGKKVVVFAGDGDGFFKQHRIGNVTFIESAMVGTPKDNVCFVQVNDTTVTINPIFFNKGHYDSPVDLGADDRFEFKNFDAYKNRRRWEPIPHQIFKRVRMKVQPLKKYLWPFG